MTRPARNRQPLPPDAVRAAYAAHLADEHGGQRGYRCTACRSYVHGIATAQARARATHDAPQSPQIGPHGPDTR